MTIDHEVTNPELAESTADQWYAWVTSRPDPVTHSLACAWMMERLKVMIDVAAQLRTDAVLELQADGWSLAEIGAELGMSRARVDQIAKRRSWDDKSTQPPASRGGS